ncbi:MAG: Gfo/Idh/MocA family oxidoreductase [Candidatus Hodarchaeota archaeon]
MNRKFNVVQVGFGAVGRLISKYLVERENINIVGIVDINPELENRKLSELLDLPNFPEMEIESALNEVLKRTQVDVVIIITSSFLEKVAPIIFDSIESSCHVVSICEELSYPFDSFPELSAKIDELAKEKNVSVVGTGINPGYLMDLLPIVLTAPCQTVNQITVTRMMNSAKRRHPFQEKIGTGLSTKEFQEKINRKEITGHVGLVQSIQLILTALGKEVDEILELPPQAVITEKEITTSYCTVPQGFVCGLISKAIAKKKGDEVIILDFIAYAGDHEEYDSVVIEGTPRISQKIEGGVHGDLGTVAMVVNLIPKICAAKAGLLTMIDLPVPCNTTGILKKVDS